MHAKLGSYVWAESTNSAHQNSALATLTNENIADVKFLKCKLYPSIYCYVLKYANKSIPSVVKINRNINIMNIIDNAEGITDNIEENNFSKLLNRLIILKFLII